jgi:hypothetical protein
MKNIKKPIIAICLILGLSVGLMGCSSDEDNNNVHPKTIEQQVKHHHEYPVIWEDTEIKQDGNGEDSETDTYLIVRYISKDKAVQSMFTHYKVVPANVKKPFLIIKKGSDETYTTAVILRPPYIKYRQEPTAGKIIKKVITGDGK